MMRRRCWGITVLALALPISFPSRPVDASGTTAQSAHPITLDEIVSFREVKEPRRSPDGSKLAFLLAQAFRSCDCYRTALYIVGTSHGSVPRKLVEETTLSSIRWTPDGNGITFLSSTSGSQPGGPVGPNS